VTALAVEWVVATAAAITASAATGTFVTSVGIYRLVKEHERTIHGSEKHEAWPGLVTMVRKHRRALEEKGVL